MRYSDFRSTLNARCVACGAHASEVKWAQLGSSYENGHVIPGPMPDVCGPMVLSADYDAYRANESLENNHAAEARLIAAIDANRPAEVLG